METVETIEWQGITIEVTYESVWFDMPEFGTAHLQLRTMNPPNAKLPVTETGFRSRFLSCGVVENAGGPSAYALAWLNEAAKGPEWKKHEAASRQHSLF